MKAIKKTAFLLFLVALIFGCTNKDASDYQDNFNFVRFGLQVNTNGQVLVFPQVQQELPEVDAYTHISTSTIRVPIVMTSALKSTATEIFYTIEAEGSFTGYQIAPVQKVIIPAGKLIDTLRISFNARWQSANVDKIKLKIVSTSDPNLNIGWKNSPRKMDALTIILGNLAKTRYNFVQNLYQIQGTINDELLIPINFSQPITNAMIGNFDFITPVFAGSVCDGASSVYNYSLIRQPFTDGALQLFYKLKILSTTPFLSNLRLTLNTGIPDFEVLGINQTVVSKPEVVSRQGDVAANWYNTADALNRTYCRPWYYDPATMQCRYGTLSQMFTKPVAVQPGSINDNGFGYHKYKIGFVGNTPPIGTNPFDFQRYYGSASTASPAFNILEALEFFPANGTSLTNGIVKVVAQTLTFVKLSNGQNINVPICGIGTYYFNSTTNRFEMYLDIHCDETAINGNNDVVRSMYIYRNNVAFAAPANLPTACSNRITL